MTEPNDNPSPYQATQEGSNAELARSILTLFPTLIVNHRLEGVDAMNSAIAKLVRAEASLTPSLATSNVGGFHSGPDFLNDESQAMRGLRERLQSLVVELTRMVLRPSEDTRKLQFHLEGWCNLLRRGDYHAMHCHPKAFWSGVYFPTANEPVDGHPLSGKLELMDPRAGAQIADPRETTLYGRYLLDPVPGQLVIFPAWLNHCVHPYFGDGDRISLGFNVNFEFRK